MKRLLLLFLLTLPLMAQNGQIPGPQDPLTGNIGSAGIFPLFNSGTITIGDADYTMSYPDMSASVIRVISSAPLTQTRRIIAPLTPPNQQGALFGYEFSVKNETQGGHAIQIIGTSGTGVLIPNGDAMMVISDGTNYIPVGIPPSAGTGGGFGNIVPNPFTSIQQAISAGGGPVIVLPSSTDTSGFSNPLSVRVQNYKQTPQGADSLFFRDVSEFGVIDGQVTVCNVVAGNKQMLCGPTFVNAQAPAGDLGKLVVIPQAGLGTYGQVYQYAPVTVTNSNSLTPGTPNSFQGIIFTDPGDCYTKPDGTPDMTNQPYGHVWLDGNGLPSGAVITDNYGNPVTTGRVVFPNFWGKGCTHPPTQGTINTVGGTVHFTGGAMAPGDLVSVITAVNGQVITLADAPTYGTGSGISVFYGTDAHDTFEAACNGISKNGFLSNGTLTFSGLALISRGIDCNAAGLHILGRGQHGLASAILYAGKTPNSPPPHAMVPGANTIYPTSYILNMSNGGAGKIERIHLIGNSQAMPYGLVASFGGNGYYTAPGTGSFVEQNTLVDQVDFDAFWGDQIPDLNTPRMQSCMFFAGFAGNADFWQFDNIYCYAADVGMDSVNDMATVIKIGKWQGEYDNIGLSFAGGIEIEDFYTEFNRADFVMGSPYWPGGVPTEVIFHRYDGESSAMSYGGGYYTAYTIECPQCALGGDVGYRRPDGIVADFLTPVAYISNFKWGFHWVGFMPGYILLPYMGQGGPSMEFAGHFSSDQFRFPGDLSPYPGGAATSGWNIGIDRFKVSGGGIDLDVPTNYFDWLGNTEPAPLPGHPDLRKIAPPLLLVSEGRSRVITGSLNVRGAQWNWIGYGQWVSNVGTPGSTTYKYQLTCSDSLGNESVPSFNGGSTTDTIFVTSTGAATLNPTNYNKMNIPGYALRLGCAAYNLYGDNGIGGAIGYLTSLTVEQIQALGGIADQGQYTKTSRVPPTVSGMGGISLEGRLQLKSMPNVASLATDQSGFVIAGAGGPGGGIANINGATGPAVNLVAGNNVTITPNGNNITIAAAGGAGPGGPALWSALSNPTGDLILDMSTHKTRFSFNILGTVMGTDNWGMVLHDAGTSNPSIPSVVLAVDSSHPNIYALEVSGGATGSWHSRGTDASIEMHPGSSTKVIAPIQLMNSTNTAPVTGAAFLGTDPSGNIVPATGTPGTSVSISALTDAVGQHSLEAHGFNQTWNWHLDPGLGDGLELFDTSTTGSDAGQLLLLYSSNRATAMFGAYNVDNRGWWMEAAHGDWESVDSDIKTGGEVWAGTRMEAPQFTINPNAIQFSPFSGKGHPANPKMPTGRNQQHTSAMRVLSLNGNNYLDINVPDSGNPTITSSTGTVSVQGAGAPGGSVSDTPLYHTPLTLRPGTVSQLIQFVGGTPPGCNAGTAFCVMTTPTVDSTYRFTFEVTQISPGVGTCSTGNFAVAIAYRNADNGVDENLNYVPVRAANNTTFTRDMVLNTTANGADRHWFGASFEFRARSDIAVQLRLVQTGVSNCDPTPQVILRPALYGPLGY